MMPANLIISFDDPTVLKQIPQLMRGLGRSEKQKGGIFLIYDNKSSISSWTLGKPHQQFITLLRAYHLGEVVVNVSTEAGSFNCAHPKWWRAIFPPPINKLQISPIIQHKKMKLLRAPESKWPEELFNYLGRHFSSDAPRKLSTEPNLPRSSLNNLTSYRLELAGP